MRVVVTGGGGFLGKKIVALLLERGDEVVSLARSDYPELRAMGAETARADLSNESEDLSQILSGADAVIHTAARVGMWGPYEEFVRANITGTARLLEACRTAGVERFVFTSSPSVTFDGGDAINEGPDTPYPDTYLSYYPQTKAEAERLVLAADSDTLRTTSLRPHLIWGPGDPHLIPRLIARARAKKLKIVGDGKNVVDITYVDNAARAHLLALDALDRPAGEPSPRGKAYYISNDEPIVLWEWINALFGRLGVPQVKGKVPARAAIAAGAAAETLWRTLKRDGEPPMTRFVAMQLATSHWYDMSPARRDFGYVPEVSMSEGVERLVASLRQER